MKVGVVGKPNVGKSSFFRALTLAKAESANYPFTTIDANIGVGFLKLKDPALDFGKRSNPREGFVQGDYRFIPVEVIDVAGLVPGAHEGKGLGNKFLDDLRQADVLIHIIDLSGSTNEKGEPVPLNTYDPSEDIKFLEDELNHWYHKIITKHFESIEKKIRMQDKKLEVALAEILSGLKINEEQIERGLRELEIDKNNIKDKLWDLSVKLRELSKPMIIGANKVDLLKSEEWREKVESLRKKFSNYIIIPTANEYELNLKLANQKGFISYIPGESDFEILKKDELNKKQLDGLNKIKEFLKDVGSTGVQEVLNRAVFDLLKYKAIFPGGVGKLEDSEGRVLPDCFLMPSDSTALDFAYKLHTDFGKNFIRAINVKTKLPIGKDAILKNGDIIEIVSGK